jgi:hypothetical protein
MVPHIIYQAQNCKNFTNITIKIKYLSDVVHKFQNIFLFLKYFKNNRIDFEEFKEFWKNTVKRVNLYENILRIHYYFIVFLIISHFFFVPL